MKSNVGMFVSCNVIFVWFFKMWEKKMRLFVVFIKIISKEFLVIVLIV